jgi:hypothetical protein
VNIAKIITSSVLLIACICFFSNSQIVHAATFDRIWATSGPYDWTPGESRQIKVTGYYKDGSHVDLTSKASGTKYEVVYDGFASDLPIVTVSPDGLMTLSDGAADGVDALIIITNNNIRVAQVGLKAKVPVKLSDINDSYAKAAIIQLVKSRAISGFNDGTFRPHSIVTHEQFTTMLSASGGSAMVVPPAVSTRPTYKDNQDTHAWYYPWVHENIFVPALVNSDSIRNATFGIGLPISRQDAIYAIMSKYFPSETSQIIHGDYPKHILNINTYPNFGDINQVKESYRDAVTVAKFLGITSGYADGNFHPNDPITREMAAQLINTAILKVISDSPNVHRFGY